MDFLHNKYDALRTFIKQQYTQKGSWEQLQGFSFENLDHVTTLSIIASSIVSLPAEELTPDIWRKFVNYLQKQDESIKVTNLGEYTHNDARIADDPSSAWQQYKKHLINQRWSSDSIANIEKSSYEVLRRLSTDTTDSSPVKGLVIGNVQSGKTANMAGLMAMAADNGFNYFIVLSGVIENLRLQTAERLDEDLNRPGNLKWQLVDNPSLQAVRSNPTYNISNYYLGENDKTRYFTVCLKNSTRLQKLQKWLYSDENKAKQLKVLIIDDEADQASVNTNKIDEEDPTKISKYIQALVNTDKVKAMNYVAYTATPYANVLNEMGENSLYPKDFITLLTPSEDYIGAKEIFGTELPETTPYIDIVREIPLREGQLVKEIQEGKTIGDLPNSFKQSIQWFILCVAAMRAIDYRNPISMLVHTSFKIQHHQKIAEEINTYLQQLRANYKEMLPELQELYENESLDFKRSYFLQGMQHYSTKDSVPDYPEWTVVEKYIERIMRLPDEEYVSHIPVGIEGQPQYHKGFHLVIDNSYSRAENQIVRLVYPPKKQMPNVAPAFIVVGGNTLSRGLTLEGLTTTYFLRTTNQADTLMQMARWFGYRKGYEIFPRVWLERLALERFQFLSQMNEELREEVLIYAEKGLTPIDYAPRIKNSPNRKLIRITSNNKMQSAEPSEYNFAGFNSQTIYFENDVSKLKHNLHITMDFLNSLQSPSLNGNRFVWRDVQSELIKEYLTEYEVCNSDIKMSSLPALIEWVEKNAENLAAWNVIYSAVGNLEETRDIDSNWNIHGYSPQASTRTKLKNRSTENLANIGALRNPSDLLADIDAELMPEEKKATKVSEVEAVRERYGYDLIPQLIIYKVDKGTMTEEEYVHVQRERAKAKGEEFDENHLKRAPLNFDEDIIGINIMIPGTSKGNLATSISAKIRKHDTQIDESAFEEESEF